MNLGIQQNLKQELKLTPEMVQSIRILQMNRLELAEYVSQEVLENPVLEEISGGEEMSAEELRNRIDSAEEDDYDRYDAYDRYDRRSHLEERGSGTGGTADYEKFIKQEETLQEHLLNQLRGSTLEEGAYRACEYMIGSLVDDGYLLLTDDQIALDCQVGGEEVQEALQCLQSMDPTGVGARSLKECLKLQLREKDLLTERMARLVDEMLEEISANHIGGIAKALGIKKPEAQAMVKEIRSLEPKPGRRFSDGQAVPYIFPDVILENVGGEVQASLNEAGAPRIQISSYYRDLRTSMDGNPELRAYLTDRFKSAEQLVQSIDQRNSTIMRIVLAIVEQQRNFFQEGNKLLRPMTMQEIADTLGLHVSTVSRAIDGKYMQYQGEIFSLRHFFGGGVALDNTEPGGASEGISGTSVRKMILDLVKSEDKAHPLSDQKLADMLNANGVKISRRTVTKYREGEGIESASKRRR